MARGWPWHQRIPVCSSKATPSFDSLRYVAFRNRADSDLILNQFIVLTIGGGCLGFYFQDKMLIQHKKGLGESVPRLEQSLLDLEAKREALEGELAAAKTGSGIDAN